MTDDLVAKLRDEDSYYRLQEKHWCIDAEELERQRLAAADRIEALEAENERLRREDWFEQFEEQEQLRDNAEQRLSVVEAENERLREVLRGVTPPAYFGESEQSKAWWAKARAALGEKQ